jgi:hypothetical protein
MWDDWFKSWRKKNGIQKWWWVFREGCSKIANEQLDIRAMINKHVLKTDEELKCIDNKASQLLMKLIRIHFII